MQQWLERMRQRPKAQRQQVAFAGAILVTGMIALVWVVSLPERFGQLSQPTPTVVAQESYFQRMFAGVRAQVASVQSSFADLTTGTPTSTVPAATSTATTTAAIDMILTPTEDHPSGTAADLPARRILIATSSTRTR